MSDGVERGRSARPWAECSLTWLLFFLNTTREWDNVVLVTGSGAVVWLFPNYL